MTNDRRTRRTQKLLKDAFIKLLSEKKLNEITVKELCDMADINRGTFYLHYQDIYDLKRKLEDEIYQQLLDIVDACPANIDEDTSYTLFIDLFRFVERHSSLLKVFLGPNGDISFLRNMQTLFKDRYLNIILHGETSSKTANLDYTYSFIASGFTGLVETWLNEENPTPLEELAKLTSKMLYDGLPSLVSYF